MSLIATLDSLEEYLNYYEYLQNSLNKAFLLQTRFKLNHGQDSFELLSNQRAFHIDNDSGIEGKDEVTSTRRRNMAEKSQILEKFVPLTKQDHINALKDTFRTLLETKIVPLAELKQKLLQDLSEI